MNPNAIPLATLILITSSCWAGYELYDDLAPKEYVDTRISSAIRPIQDSLDTILANQVALQLAEIYRAMCDGYSSRESEIMVMNLEAEYLKRAKTPYKVPSCERLTRGRQ